MFAWVLARVEKKLEGWKEKLISKAGKAILIKTVVQALPQYAMSLFKIPISICRALEQRISNFWWKQNSAKKGVHWKNWDLLKTRKDCGGLGFRDLVTFNKSLLGKQTWRLIQAPEALWSRILRTLYFPRDTFWNAHKGHRPSWGWQSLLIGREVIEPAIKWEVRGGEEIRIREDRWLTMGKIGGPPNREDPQKVAELIHQNTREWNAQKINMLFSDGVAKEILATPLSLSPKPDQLLWTANGSGSYIVKSGYNLLQRL